jgi:hypothetical protein
MSARGWILVAALAVLVAGAAVVAFHATQRAGDGRDGDAKGAEAPAVRSPKPERPGNRAEPRRRDRVPSVPTRAAVARARRFAGSRVGVVSFAVVGSSGKVHCRACRRRYRAASVVKAMLLVAELRRLAAAGGQLTATDRALLGAMIRVSDNASASSIYLRVGDQGLYRLAEAAGMRGLGVYGHWGNAETTALDQARFVARIDRLTPARYRRDARRLLSSVVASQAWGIPKVSRPRWRTAFKGGWVTTPRGELVHQVARLQRGKRAVAIAVLTDGNPTHAYGRATVRGIAARLLGRSRVRARRLAAVRRGNGRLKAVAGTSGVIGSGAPQRFSVEVEQGLGIDARAFAASVVRILTDRRSWRGTGIALRRVDRGPVSFRIALASPPTADRLCAPLRTNGRFSCFMRDRAVLNLRRWRHGAEPYGRLRTRYRAYMVNHEVGHALGHGHRGCSEPGRPAPVMMQQTKGTAPCRPNPWPVSARF